MTPTAKHPEVADAREAFALRCTVNGRLVERPVAAHRALLDFLRDDLGLTGTKGACLEGECGSCTVILDGAPVNSCMTLAGQVHGRSVTTIEGLATDRRLEKLQQAFLSTGAAQCGYCTPGLIMAAHARLQADPRLTPEQMIECIEANICRCTGYASILAAIQSAAQSTAQPASAAPSAEEEHRP